MVLPFFAFKYRPNEGNNIFLNLVSVVLYSSFALKGKRLASSEDGSTSVEMVKCYRRLMLFFFFKAFIITVNWADYKFILITEEA